MPSPIFHTSNGFNRSAIMTAAWVQVREQQEYYRSLADILPMPATGKLLSDALKAVWRIARGQRAKAVEAARIASPEYRAEIEAKRVAAQQAKDAEQAARAARWSAIPAAEREAIRQADLARFAAGVAELDRPNA